MQYLWWKRTDTDVSDKIDGLVADIEIQPFKGLGKPEPLKENLSGYWSRRITGEHRLVYDVSGPPDKQLLYILSC
jgi:toxin YoeB